MTREENEEKGILPAHTRRNTRRSALNKREMTSIGAYEQYVANKYAHIKIVHPLAAGREFLPCVRPVSLSIDWEILLELSQRHEWVLPDIIRKQLNRPGTALVLTDCRESIIWVNRGFTRMTGYSFREVVGKHPNFLQGASTDPIVKRRIRRSLHQNQPYSGTILNYRKDSRPYLCHVRIQPLYNLANEVVNYLAIENEVKNKM
jgi:PAS domain S-box-containing protein